MRIQQLATPPCATCALVSQLIELTVTQKREFQKHLRAEHDLKPYFIPK